MKNLRSRLLLPHASSAWCSCLWSSGLSAAFTTCHGMAGRTMSIARRVRVHRPYGMDTAFPPATLFSPAIFEIFYVQSGLDPN